MSKPQVEVQEKVPKKEDRILGIRFGEYVDLVNNEIEKSGKPIGEFIRDAVLSHIKSQGKTGSITDRLGNLEGKTEEMSNQVHGLDARLTTNDLTVQSTIDKAKQELDGRVADAIEEVNEKLGALETVNQEISKAKQDIDTLARAVGIDLTQV